MMMMNHFFWIGLLAFFLFGSHDSLGGFCNAAAAGASSSSSAGFVVPRRHSVTNTKKFKMLKMLSTTTIHHQESNMMRRSKFFDSSNHHHPALPFLSIRGGGGSAASRYTTTQLHLQPPTSFDNSPFTQYNTILLAANVLGFIISLITGGSHLHLDLLGTGAFAMAAIPSGLAAVDIPRVQLSAGCVALWGVKLASFLFWRATQMKRDMRLEEQLSTVGGTASFWVLSLLWGILTSLPHSLGATSSSGTNVPLLSQNPTSIVGACLFLLGFVVETTADYQKTMFKRQNPGGGFCNVGLWSISQHPNFCGNIILWSGIFLLNAPALIDPPIPSPSTNIFIGFLQHVWRFKRVALAALSPLFLYQLFNGQASGSFSNTQDLFKTKYGDNPEFIKYTTTVPLLFPKFPFASRSNE